MTVLFIGSLVTRPAAPAAPVERQEVTLYGAEFEPYNIGFFTALSLDGSALVFSDTAGGTRQLRLKERDQAQAVPVPGTEGAWFPFFSPDGQWLGFFADGKMWKVPRRGGSAFPLADASNTENARGGAWLDDGTIVFNHGWSLYRVSESGGEAELLLESSPGDTTGFDRWVVGGIRALPGNRGVLFSGLLPGLTEFEVYVFDFATGEARRLIDDASTAWHTPLGHLLYARRDGGVFAVPFDDQSLRVTGAALPVLSDARVTDLGYPDILLGAEGTLLYVSGEPLENRLLRPVWVDRSGTAVPVDSTWAVSKGAWIPSVALAPDDSKLVVTHFASGTVDLWVKELDHGPFTKLTFEGGLNTRPTWSPDGSAVWFISDREGHGGLWSKRSDGSAQAVAFERLSEQDVQEVVLSPQGQPTIVRVGSWEGRDLLLVQEGDAVDELLSEEHEEHSATLSPDGRWMAYVSDESGSTEVYVRPFPDASASRQQLSKSGGTEPLWSHSGREIFYINGGGSMVAAQVVTDPTFRIEGESVLFPTEGVRDGVHRAYDVSRDDQRFVMLIPMERDDEETQDKLILVKNWFTELEEILGSE
jgi:serine/threonine-protein kinase